MVKCKTRKRANALHEFCLQQEAAAQAKKEAKRRKQEERRQAELAAAAGADGQVAALDGVRYGGSFGVKFAADTPATAAGAHDDDDDERMDEDDSGRPKKLTKHLAWELGRKQHLIKKAQKMQKAKVGSSLAHLQHAPVPVCASACPSARRPPARRPLARPCPPTAHLPANGRPPCGLPWGGLPWAAAVTSPLVHPCSDSDKVMCRRKSALRKAARRWCSS